MKMTLCKYIQIMEAMEMNHEFLYSLRITVDCVMCFLVLMREYGIAY